MAAHRPVEWVQAVVSRFDEQVTGPWRAGGGEPGGGGDGLGEGRKERPPPPGCLGLRGEQGPSWGWPRGASAGSWGSPSLLKRGGGAFSAAGPPTPASLLSQPFRWLPGMRELGALSGALHLDSIVLPYFLFIYLF